MTQGAGSRRHFIEVLDDVESDDGRGGTTTTGICVLEAYAEVRPLDSREEFHAAGIRSGVTHEVKIPYSDLVKERMRISYRGRTLHILGRRDPGERRRRLHLLCKEVVT